MMVIFHYVGVVLSIGILIGFNWQITRMLHTHDTEDKCSNIGFIIYVIFLDIFAISGLISWRVWLKKGENCQKYLLENIVNKNVEYDPYKISNISLIHIGINFSDPYFFVYLFVSAPTTHS